MVHTGTANQGHYFSYIRDPSLDPSPSPPTRYPSDDDDDGPSGGGGESIPSADNRGSGTSTAATANAASPAARDGAAPPLSQSTPPAGSGAGAGRVGGVDGHGKKAKGSQKWNWSQKWCEFNDTVVKEWSVEGRRRRGNDAGAVGGDPAAAAGRSGSRLGLENDCFGGQQTMQVSYDGRNGHSLSFLVGLRVCVLRMPWL